MITQEQAVASTSILTIVVGYYFWTLMQNNLLLPYIKQGTPEIGNILIFLILLSLLISGLITVIVAILSTLISSAKENVKPLKGVSVWIIHLILFNAILLLLLLDVFHVVAFPITILSYVLVSGIVLYGKIKEKKRFKKYIAKSNRRAKE